MIQVAKQIIKIAKELIASGKAVNRNTDFFKSLIPIGKRSGRATYKDIDGYYYQWDYLHGEWQKFQKNGYHVGVTNENGIMIKDSIKGRKIKL